MTTNLLDMLDQAVTPDLLGGLSKLLDESESSLASGIRVLLPALLAAMANQASTPDGAASLYARITDPQIEPDLTERLATLVKSNQSTNLLMLGDGLLSGLFGNQRKPALSSALASAAGIRSASADYLSAAMAPLVFSLLKRLIGERSLDPKGLAALLLGQRDYLAGRLDPGLVAAMGLGTPTGFLEGLGAAATRLGTAAPAGASGAAAGRPVATAGAGGPGMGRILAWVLWAALVLFILAQFSNCGGTTQEPPAGEPPAKTGDASSNGQHGKGAPALAPAAASGTSGTSAAQAGGSAAAPGAGSTGAASTSGSSGTGAAAGTGGTVTADRNGQQGNGAPALAPAAANGGGAAATPAGSGASPTAGAGGASTASGMATGGGDASISSAAVGAGAGGSAGSTGPAPSSASAGAPITAGASAPASSAAAATALLPARIYFETGSAEIGPQGRETIIAVGRALATGSPAGVELTGYTDRTGDTAVNEELSRRRAQAVRAALLEAGAAEAAIGMKPPFFVEAGHAGADAEARRVEISVGN